MTDVPANDVGSTAASEPDAKDTQRQLQKARDAAKVATKNALDNAQIRIDVAAQTKAILDLTEYMKGGAVDDDILDKSKRDIEAVKERMTVRSQWTSQINDLVIDGGIEWEDSSLETARSLWEGGNYPAAHQEVMRVTGGSGSSDDIQAQIKEGIAAELSRLGQNVDVGSSTAPMGTQKTLGDMPTAADIIANPGQSQLNMHKLVDELLKPRGR